MTELVLLAFVLGLVAGYGLIVRLSRPRFFAIAEYWVYLPGIEMPPQDAVMDRLLRANPYRIGGKAPIGPPEGLLLSDVRFHMALVMRSKNPHVFRPDLFEEHVEPTQEALEILAESHSLVKVRFHSEKPLPDKRHVQLLIHAADAVAELGGGQLVFDVPQERLITREELAGMLGAELDATRPELHVRTVWNPTDGGGKSETRGLAKIGAPEMMTEEVEADERVLVSSVMEEAARSVWLQGALPPTVEVEAFSDRFRLLIRRKRKGPAAVRILRVQAI